MEKKSEIRDLRERLDKTLALPDLSNEDSLRSLVKNQLLCSSLSSFRGDVDKIVEKRTKEVFNLLETLRSASENERKAKAQEAIDWKIKQDTDELRVMYREGPEGTPFHTLLAEGYADGPLDVCLCVSWEATLYKKWFPQYKVPNFKILLSTCLQKVRVGEEISLVRVKVTWPISDREALLHYFEIEYLQEDVVLVLLNTISDRNQVDESVDGFSGSVIPESKDATRIDLVGGFVLQKVDANRSYFRSVATMDIKLDFVPPWLINFMSRQLIGNGHKLFQKALRTVAIQDEDYLEALKGPLYARLRDGLGAKNKNKATENGSNNEKLSIPPEVCMGDASTSEIIEVGDDAGLQTEQQSSLRSNKCNDDQTINLVNDYQDGLGRVYNVSSEVAHALHILDSAIAVLRSQNRSQHQMNANPGPVNVNTAPRPQFLESMNKVTDEGSLGMNGFHKRKDKHGRKKWLCSFCSKPC